MKTTGKFYGIGVGPGDPELLTRKAARLLAEVDWIFLPAPPAGGQGFAAAIVESLRLDTNKFRPVTLCMSRQRHTDLDAYERTAAEILAELRRGHSAAWITEGDPLFYSTFLHVWSALLRLDADLQIEIVPGITSIQAAAAYAQAPIATLDERVAVVPASYGLANLSELLKEFAVVFLLKVHGVFDELLDRLAALSESPQTIYVEKVGTPEQRVVHDLTTLRGKSLPYFSLVILRKDSGRTS